MAWMDLRRHVFAYILNRMSVFTDLDSDQLEISGTSFRVRDLRIDPEKISSSGLKVDSASAQQVSVELSTLGILVKIQELDLRGSLNALEPDLGLSTVLEQTQLDLDDSLNQKSEPSYMTQKLSEIVLSQLRIEVNALVLVLRVGQLDITVDVGLLVVEKQKITFESINVSCKPLERLDPPGPVDLGESRSPSPFPPRTVRFADSPGSSQYASACEYFPGEELALHISAGHARHDYPLQNVSVEIESIKANALPLAWVLVAVLQTVFDLPSSGGDGDAHESAVKVEVAVEELCLADCSLSSEGAYEDPEKQVVKLKGIVLSPDELIVDRIEHPALDIFAPVLSVALGRELGKIVVKVSHPIAITMSPDCCAALLALAQELAAVFGHLQPPEASDPAKVEIELGDISIKLGDLSILVLSQELDLDRLKFSEILLTAGVDRLVVTALEVDLQKRRLSAQKIVGQVSNDCSRVLSGFLIDKRQPRDPFKPSTASMASSGSSLGSGSSRGGAKPSWGMSVDSVVVSGFDAIISTPFMASYSTEFRAKLKPELVYQNHRFNLAVQLVMNEMLVVYIDMVSATVKLEPPEPTPKPKRQPQPPQTSAASPAAHSAVSFPFPIDVFIKGSCTIHANDLKFSARLDEVLNANLKEDWMNIHLPHLQLLMLDGASQVHLGDLKGLNLRGNFTKSQFALTVAKIVGSCATDSFYALKQLANYLKPPSQHVEFAVDGPDGLNVFADIDEDAFGSSGAPPARQVGLQYVESYYPKSHSLEENFVDLAESMQKSPAIPLSIQEDYLLSRRSASPKVSQQPTIRVKLLLKSVSWDLYDGYDLLKTRKALKAAVDRVSSISAQLNQLEFEQESPIVGDLMFNSVYIGAKLAKDMNFGDEIEHDLGGKALRRSGAPKVSLRVQSLKLDTKVFCPDEVGELANTSLLTVEEFAVRDLVPTSSWKSLLSYDKAVQGHRRSSMATLNLETIHSQDPELRISASVAPLRVQLDQDTLEFLTRFFEFEPDSGFDEEQEFSAPQAPSLQPFIQRFELADLHICLDYKPKKVDYAGLRSGHAAEFMNIFVVEKSSLVLRHVILHGVSGFSQLGTALNNTWTPDVRNNQLVNLLRGLGPLKSIIQVAGGIKKFVVTPVKEYRRESGVASGIRRGSTVLAKNTANELVRLGVRVINGPKRQNGSESALDESESALD